MKYLGLSTDDPEKLRIPPTPEQMGTIGAFMVEAAQSGHIFLTGGVRPSEATTRIRSRRPADHHRWPVCRGEGARSRLRHHRGRPRRRRSTGSPASPRLPVSRHGDPRAVPPGGAGRLVRGVREGTTMRFLILEMGARESGRRPGSGDGHAATRTTSTAGVLLAAETLHPSRTARGSGYARERTRIDGAFGDPGDLDFGPRPPDPGGFAAEALAWAWRCPVDLALDRDGRRYRDPRGRRGHLADVETRERSRRSGGSSPRG